jgi:hypothetical protein
MLKLKLFFANTLEKIFAALGGTFQGETDL